MDMSVRPNSEMAASSKKAQSMCNGGGGSREEQAAVLAGLITQNNMCELCHKCISEKKKLAAHRKVCLLKAAKKAGSGAAAKNKLMNK